MAATLGRSLGSVTGRLTSCSWLEGCSAEQLLFLHVVLGCHDTCVTCSSLQIPGLSNTVQFCRTSAPPPPTPASVGMFCCGFFDVCLVFFKLLFLRECGLLFFTDCQLTSSFGWEILEVGPERSCCYLQGCPLLFQQEAGKGDDHPPSILDREGGYWVLPLQSCCAGRMVEVTYASDKLWNGEAILAASNLVDALAPAGDCAPVHALGSLTACPGPCGSNRIIVPQMWGLSWHAGNRTSTVLLCVSLCPNLVAHNTEPTLSRCSWFSWAILCHVTLVTCAVFGCWRFGFQHYRSNFLPPGSSC